MAVEIRRAVFALAQVSPSGTIIDKNAPTTTIKTMLTASSEFRVSATGGVASSPNATGVTLDAYLIAEASEGFQLAHIDQTQVITQKMERIIRLVDLYDLAAPGADTDAFTVIKPKTGVYAWRVTVALTVSSVFNVSATDGTTAHIWGLNASAALNAADVYTFEHAVDPDVSYSYQVETDGIVEMLTVDELISE